MTRPRTLFTGQWADMPLSELAEKAAGWGYDGLELACWGDHFEVDRALAEEGYCQGRHDLLAAHDRLMQAEAVAKGMRSVGRWLRGSFGG